MSRLNQTTIWQVFCVAGLCMFAASSVSAQSSIVEPIVIKSALVKVAETTEIPVEQAGVLTKLNVKQGQRVRVGDLIASVDNRAFLLRLERARMDHEVAKKEAQSRLDFEYAQKSYLVAMSDVRRSEEANQRVPNSIPQSRIEKQILERERARLLLEKSQSDLEVAAMRTRLTAADIEAAKLELAKTEVFAKSEGIVIVVEKQVGEWVQPSDVVCQVVQTDRLKIEGFLPAADASRIRVGSRAQVDFDYRWMTQKRIEGEVLFVSPSANPNNLQVVVSVEIPNVDRNIPTGARGNISIVPASSIKQSR